ncbi:MAG: hypothetical protein ACYDAM_10000 [Leptospirales bacterium]
MTRDLDGRFSFFLTLALLLLLDGCGILGTGPMNLKKSSIVEVARQSSASLIRGLKECAPRKIHPVVEVGEVGGSFSVLSRRDLPGNNVSAHDAIYLFREYLIDDLVKSRAIRYVTASEVKRFALERERLFQLRHDRMSSIHSPGRLIGADYGVVAHFIRIRRRWISAHLEAIDLTSNVVCWARTELIRY